MAFKKLDFKKLSKKEMLERSKSFLSEISTRRTVREFSTKTLFKISTKKKLFQCLVAVDQRVTLNNLTENV